MQHSANAATGRPFARMAALLALACAVLSGCSRAGYSQKSPEATISTARLMIENGDASKLPNLIYAPDKDFRALMKRLGVLTGRLQETAEVLAARFPDDVAKLKQAAEEDPAGQAGKLMNAFGDQRRRRGPPSPDQQRQGEDQFNALVKGIFADPFGWLRDGEQRLTTVEVDDTTVAVLLDGQPVLAPVGLVMKKADDGKWYFVIPTSIPGVGNFAPQNLYEYRILASLFKVFDNALVDLQVDLKTGKVKSLEDVARATGEKAFVPAVMTFFAYNKAMEARKSEAKPPAVKAPATPK